MFFIKIVGGFRLLYERKVPFELVISDQEVIEKVGEPVIRPEEMLIKLLISVSLPPFHSFFTHLNNFKIFLKFPA